MHAEENRGANDAQSMSLKEIRRLVLEEEAQGFDVPFATFTWQHWQELQTRFVQNMTRFQRAIEQRRIDVALFSGLEAQEIATELLKEACSWIGVVPRPDTGPFHLPPKG
jgi:hypothetical protein